MATAQQQAKATAKEEPKQPPRPVGDIRNDIEVTRVRLAGNIEQLKAETTPKALGNKAQEKAKSVVMNEDGSVRVERVAAIAGVVLGLLLLRKGFKTRSRKKHLMAMAQVVWVPVPRSSVNPELAGLARNAKELAPLTQDYVPQLALANA